MAKKKVAPNAIELPVTPTKKKPTPANRRPAKGPAKKRVAKKASTKTTGVFHEFPTELESAQVRLLPASIEIEYERAKIALETEMEQLQQLPGFLFADVGYKFTDGLKTDYLAVRIHVRSKISKHEKCVEKMCLNGTVPTDVIVSNFCNSASSTDAGSKIRSNGLPSQDFGTLGMAVTGSSLGRQMFLTCAHVVTSDPPVVANNTIKDSAGNDIARSANRDSRFYRYDGRFDVALLAPAVSIPPQDLGRFASNLPPGVSPPNRFGGVTSADLNRVVYKIGANLPHPSTGFIDSIQSLPIPIRNSPAAIDHIIVRSTQDGSIAPRGLGFANLGDSGAMVFTDDGRIIGMIRAVLDDNSDNEGDRAVVTRMTSIAASFPIRF